MKKKKNNQIDKVEGNRIILDGMGKFPKLIVVVEQHATKEYRLIRTRSGKFQLNK